MQGNIHCNAGSRAHLGYHQRRHPAEAAIIYKKGCVLGQNAKVVYISWWEKHPRLAYQDISHRLLF
jgi:hypothetical protein